MEIPELLRRLITQREGAAGVAWLTSLPALVDELLERWECVPTGRWLSGKVGLVVPANSALYGDVVLKVSFPHPGNVYEPEAYATWRGHGSVVLWERDEARLAMLLERIGPGSPVDAVAIDEAIGIAGNLVRRLAVPAPSHLPRLSDEAQGWIEIVRRALARLPARVVDPARETLFELCLEQPSLMVHGDLHFNNILRGVRQPWQVIDPKGCAGDPAYDAITLLRTTAIHLLKPSQIDLALPRWVTIFAEAAELDCEHVRRWAQARAVVIAQRSWEQNKPQSIRDMNDQISEYLS